MASRVRSWELSAAVLTALAVLTIVTFVKRTHPDHIQHQLNNHYLELWALRHRLHRRTADASETKQIKFNIQQRERRIGFLVHQYEEYAGHSGATAHLRSPLPPPPRSAVHALLYHGAHFRVPSGMDGHTTWGGLIKCTDFLQVRDNHEERLIGPLRANSRRVHIFVHTYASGCPERDEALLRYLNPTRHRIELQTKKHKIVDSYLASLQLLRESNVSVDFVTMVRFDLYFRAPVLSLHIDWTRLNLNWKAELLSWHTLRATSDLFSVMPRRFIDAYSDALVWSGNSPDVSLANLRGAAHWVYEPLSHDPRVGEGNISFVRCACHLTRVPWFDNAAQSVSAQLSMRLLRLAPNATHRSSTGTFRQPRTSRIPRSGRRTIRLSPSYVPAQHESNAASVVPSSSTPATSAGCTLGNKLRAPRPALPPEPCRVLRCGCKYMLTYLLSLEELKSKSYAVLKISLRSEAPVYCGICAVNLSSKGKYRQIARASLHTIYARYSQVMKPSRH